jgi:hypothetical protein
MYAVIKKITGAQSMRLARYERRKLSQQLIVLHNDTLSRRSGNAMHKASKINVATVRERHGAWKSGTF